MQYHVFMTQATMATDEESRFSVLMFPWLAYGHVSPFFELAKKLSNRNLYIYFCSTPINLKSINKSLSSDDLSSNIELIEFHLQNSPPQLPPHYHTTNGLPRHLISTLFTTLNMSKPHLTDILRTLNPDLIIYDVFPPWITELAVAHEIPAVHFMCAGAASSSFWYSSFKNSSKEDSMPLFPSSTIFLKESEINANKSALEDLKSSLVNSFENSCDVILIKSCRDIEGKYLDYHARSLFPRNKKIIPIGLLPQETRENKKEGVDIKMIMQWLSKKDHKSSTIYVSLGSENFLCREDMEELAYGLELSNVNFIWAIRFPEGENLRAKDTLPKGFLERVKGKGMIIEGWAPQMKILGHPNIGGFMSHCGWSSVIESLGFGVPVIGIPMRFDQPLNARLLEELGVGLEVVKNDKLGLERSEVARVIKEVVVEKSGENIRKKARAFGDKMRKNGDDEIEDGMEELKKLCQNKNRNAGLN